MKQVIILLSLLTISFASNAQSEAKKEIADARAEVKQSLREAQTVVKNIDWTELGNVFTSTFNLLEKNVDVILDEVQKIDFKKLETKANNIAKKIEKSEDLKEVLKSRPKRCNKK
jgi:2-oxoglutarate dehydrogenase complex dehydrogenase (E1) component-like enzyme